MTPRLFVLSISLLAMLSGCSWLPSGNESAPGVVVTDASRGSTAMRMENAIASTLLADAVALLSVEGAMPLVKLTQLHTQLNEDVNDSLLTDSNRRARQILGFILENEQARRNENHFGQTVERLTHLNLTALDLTTSIEARLAELDTVLSAADPGDTGSYPADTHDGRQTYMDTLSDAFIQGQFRWYDSLTRYDESTFSIAGLEDDSVSYLFDYEPATGELNINLTDTRTLPYFELDGLTAFYGFPGLHSLHAGVDEGSVQQFLHLPGYTLGWALYITGFIAEALAGEDSDIQAYMFTFLRLQVSLAMADLNVHTGVWQPKQALEYLKQNRGYSEARLKLHLREIQSRPGYYLAAYAGSTRMDEIAVICESKPGCTRDRLHQAIVALGPVPFVLLEKRVSEAFY